MLRYVKDQKRVSRHVPEVQRSSISVCKGENARITSRRVSCTVRFCLLYRGGPRTRSQNCSDFWTHIWSRANRYCKAFEASLAEVRGLPRPPEASLMGFRGLPRPHEASTKSQNSFSLQDYEASGTRAYNTIKRVPARPRARTNPGCLFHVKDKRILSRGWLQVLFILYSKRHDRPRRASTD